MPQVKSPISQIALLCLLIPTVISACRLITPVVNPGEVLFQDDFSRTDSGWDRYADESYSADYYNGGYRIKVDAADTLVWTLPDVDFENVLIRVEGSRLQGPEDNVYGVICRYVNPENFIFFLISSDGYAGIGRYAAGVKELLNHETLLPTDAIAAIDETNLIQAACIENELTFWVNGEVIALATIAELSNGNVGLIAGTYEEAGVEIFFDNFSTLMP